MLQYFGAETITATWTTGNVGSYVDGEWVPDRGTESTINIIAPQPIDSNSMTMLEDGEHVKDYLVTWSQTAVSPRQGDQEGDLIEFKGRSYEVMQVDDRSILSPHYRIVMRWQNDR